MMEPLLSISPAPPLPSYTLATYLPAPSPSFPAVKMVCKMLLGDAKVLKWLLVACFKGAFPGPAMKQLT